MNNDIREEIERLTSNSTTRREDLLVSAHRKLRTKKMLSIFSGLLALGSAGAITTVLVDAFGDRGLQILAAATAALAGTITLVMSSYFSEEDVASMFTGSSKYLALRENVYRLVIHPTITEEGRFAVLTELQEEYTRLDESYSRFFSYSRGGGYRGTSRPPLWHHPMMREAGEREMERVRRELDRMLDAT